MGGGGGALFFLSVFFFPFDAKEDIFLTGRAETTTPLS